MPALSNYPLTEMLLTLTSRLAVLGPVWTHDPKVRSADQAHALTFTRSPLLMSRVQVVVITLPMSSWASQWWSPQPSIPTAAADPPPTSATLVISIVAAIVTVLVSVVVVVVVVFLPFVFVSPLVDVGVQVIQSPTNPSAELWNQPPDPPAVANAVITPSGEAVAWATPEPSAQHMVLFVSV